jgi:hypothetical protein
MTTTSMEAPFGWFTRIGMELLSFFAQFGEAGSRGASGGDQAQGSSGAAHGAYSAESGTTDQTGKKPPYPMPACCHVAFPNGPYCDYSGSDPRTYTCPPGYYRQWWFCPDQPPAYGACAECTTDQTTCWSGNFNCSTWWYI